MRSYYGVSDWMNEYNIRNNKTCYDCLAPLCGDCRRDDAFHGGVGFCLKSCTPCDKTYCTDCVSVTRCSSCSEAYCEGCGEMEECDECENSNCRHCLYSCDSCGMNRCTDCAPYHRCEGRNCTNQNCADCYDSEEYSVKYCRECENEYCNGCRLEIVKKYGAGECCSGCAGDVVVPHLLQQVEEMAKLRKENKELREKVEHMSLYRRSTRKEQSLRRLSNIINDIILITLNT